MSFCAFVLENLGLVLEQIEAISYIYVIPEIFFEFVNFADTITVVSRIHKYCPLLNPARLADAQVPV